MPLHLAYLILLGDGMSYAINDILIDGATGATAETLSLTLSPDLLVILLAVIPVLSAADAYLEYRWPSTAGSWIRRSADRGRRTIIKDEGSPGRRLRRSGRQ